MQREKYLSTPVKLSDDEIEEFQKRQSMQQVTTTPVLVLDNLERSESIHDGSGGFNQPKAQGQGDRPLSRPIHHYQSSPVELNQVALPENKVQGLYAENYYSSSDTTIPNSSSENVPKSNSDAVVITNNDPEQATVLFRPSTWKRKHNLIFASLLSVALVVGAALALFIVLLKSKGGDSNSGSTGSGIAPPSTLDKFRINYTTEAFVNLPKGSSPNGLRFDKNGNLFVVLFGSNKVVKIVGSTVQDFAGSGVQGRLDGLGTSATFTTPGSAVVDSKNNVFVSDSPGNQLREIDPSGRVTTPCKNLNSPFGLAIDSSDAIYIADNQKSRIAKCIAGSISFLTSANNPFGLAIDFPGNLYYTTGLQNTLVRLDVQNSYTSTDLTLTIDGSVVPLSNPNNLAFDVNGYLYVAERGRNVIRKINVLTSDSYTIGEGLSFPSDVAIKDGIVYVADGNNDRIVKLVPQDG